MSKMISMKLTHTFLLVFCALVLASIPSYASDNKDLKPPFLDSLDYNFFSPNNDSINDTFVLERIKNGEYGTEPVLFVFNRWGDLVYKSDKPYKNDWDGKSNQGNKLIGNELPEGIYYFRVDYVILDKETSKAGTIVLKR